MPTTAPYGTWKSPIVADLITQKTISLSEVLVDPVTKKIYHAESRPSEGGRIVLVDTERGEDVTGKDWNVRSGVHEYGGAACAVRGGIIAFTHYGSKRLYLVGKDGSAEPVSPDNDKRRFGDFEIHPTHPHLIVSILEDHTKPAIPDVATSLVVINTKTQAAATIASGADFYSTPHFSSAGDKISWIQWWHPDMPWEGSELVVGSFFVDGDTPSVKDQKIIAGEKGKESINQSQWIDDDTVIFLTDKSGFYNPWKYSVAASKASPILPSPVDHEYADPAWQLGASRWSPLSSKTIFISPTDNGVVYLALLDVDSGKVTKIESPYVNIAAVHALNEHQAVFVGTTDEFPATLVLMTLPAMTAEYAEPLKASFKVLKETSSVASTFDSGLFPKHQAIALSIPASGQPLHVLYFPPTNPEYSDGKQGELPPCVLNIHGGPTGRVAPGLSWISAYFTSRGWAWVDLNYGGSSGYGREYRERLRGNWGVVDVDDCVTAIEQLSSRKLIDLKRVAIRGGSAGGYTVLAALVAKPNAFTVGTSSYGISDLSMLANDTHKFESQYLFKLIGGTPEEVPQVYKDRSPVFHADKIAAPLLILQGAIDAVVPPSQAEAIVKKIKERDGKVQYIVFEGEGHGWRKAVNIKKALETEESFYREVFGLTA